MSQFPFSRFPFTLNSTPSLPQPFIFPDPFLTSPEPHLSHAASQADSQAWLLAPSGLRQTPPPAYLREHGYLYWHPLIPPPSAPTYASCLAALQAELIALCTDFDVFFAAHQHGRPTSISLFVPHSVIPFVTLVEESSLVDYTAANTARVPPSPPDSSKKQNSREEEFWTKQYGMMSQLRPLSTLALTKFTNKNAIRLVWAGTNNECCFWLERVVVAKNTGEIFVRADISL
ncbi:hypothetical protein K1719_033940 [Acacia pycnantha]|nr:hypothetical protein K1719_033940 [Acacia pycnantha]